MKAPIHYSHLSNNMLYKISTEDRIKLVNAKTFQEVVLMHANGDYIGKLTKDDPDSLRMFVKCNFYNWLVIWFRWFERVVY